jgi:hypothetical protein
VRLVIREQTEDVPGWRLGVNGLDNVKHFAGVSSGSDDHKVTHTHTVGG